MAADMASTIRMAVDTDTVEVPDSDKRRTELLVQYTTKTKFGPPFIYSLSLTVVIESCLSL